MTTSLSESPEIRDLLNHIEQESSSAAKIGSASALASIGAAVGSTLIPGVGAALGGVIGLLAAGATAGLLKKKLDEERTLKRVRSLIAQIEENPAILDNAGFVDSFARLDLDESTRDRLIRNVKAYNETRNNTPKQELG